jgi:hypothetical protein
MTDHLLSWTATGLFIGWVIGAVGILAIASGFDWLQWLITSMFVGLVVGAVAGVATLRDRSTWGESPHLHRDETR